MSEPAYVAEEELERQFDCQYDMVDAVVLGEGTYGKVYTATQISTGNAVAMKCMKLHQQDEGVPSTAIREVAVLKGLHHPHIVRLLDVFCSTKKLVLVLEFLETDLKKYIKASNGNLPSATIKDFSLQLMRGIEYCHSMRFIHRDLKPQNLLISSSNLLKIADFGLSRAFVLPMPEYTHEVVTVWYRPPEILLGVRVYSIQVDIWGVGCIIAEMASGSPLFRGDSEIGTCMKIFEKFGTPTQEVWPGVNELPDFKPTFPKWRHRGWANIRNIAAQVGRTGIDLLEKLMQYDPATRMSARKALDHPYFDETADRDEVSAVDDEMHVKNSSQVGW